MSRTLVISQPFFLPWIGLFEQVRLADEFIHYDDVPMPQGRSFISRVQIKSAQGVSWLTAPVDHNKSGRLINEIFLISDHDWRRKHLRTIELSYAKAPHFKLMFGLIEKIYSYPTDRLAELNINAIESLARWLGLSPRFVRSSAMTVKGASTQRLADLCRAVNCNVYVTGHGGLNYLKYDLFEDQAIAVRYIDYEKLPYSQLHGEFAPYVSILDAIANCGEQVRELLRSDAVDWRSFRIS